MRALEGHSRALGHDFPRGENPYCRTRRTARTGTDDGPRSRALDDALHRTGGCPWPAGGDGERAAISRGPRIVTLLEDAGDWFDLEGALGMEVSMVSDLGVFREDCEVMVVILVE